MVKDKLYIIIMMNMMVSGEMDCTREMVSIILLTEIFMKELSFKIKKMVMENIQIKMVNNILVCGKMICKKVMVSK